jgi:hypothetical protein
MRALQVEFPKCGVCVDLQGEGGIYRGEWDLHRLSPPTQASPPGVDVWQPSFGLNHLGPWPAGRGVVPADRPLGPLG